MCYQTLFFKMYQIILGVLGKSVFGTFLELFKKSGEGEVYPPITKLREGQRKKNVPMSWIVWNYIEE